MIDSKRITIFISNDNRHSIYEQTTTCKQDMGVGKQDAVED